MDNIVLTTSDTYNRSTMDLKDILIVVVVVIVINRIEDKDKGWDKDKVKGWDKDKGWDKG